MKYIYLDDYDFFMENFSIIKRKNVILTSSIGIYEIVKNKLNGNVILLNSKSFTENYKNLKKYFLDFQHILRSLDNNKTIKEYIENKNLNLFFNSHRYSTAMDFAAIKNITQNIFLILKKKKIKKLYLYGNLRFNFFSKEVLQKELKSKKIDLIIVKRKTYIKKNIFNIFNTITIYQIFLYLKKIIANIFFFTNKKNIVIEPNWDFFYFNYSIRNTFFLNLKKKLFDKNDLNHNNLSINYSKISKILKKNESKEILFYLIEKTLILDKKLSLIFNYLDLLMKKNHIKNCIWSCDPDSIAANIVQYLRQKNIKIYGIQHGGSYNIINYRLFHYLSDFKFCDTFLSYGNSKNIIDKNIINFGSFKSSYYLKNKKNIFNSEFKKTTNILFIVGAIYEIFLNKNSYIKQFNFQKNVCEFLDNKKINSIIKIPRQINCINFPILDKVNNDYNNFKISKKKIFQEINSSKPKIIILDRLSSTLYECLFYDVNIILFIDKNELPYNDVLKILKKRVFVVHNFNEFISVFEKIITKKIVKKDDTFLKKYFLLKQNKQNKELLKKIN